MLRSVGKVKAPGKVHYSFPLQTLSFFRQCEGIASDPNEGSTLINLGSKGGGRITTCNEALISCWSVCNSENPWSDLENSSFAKNKIEFPYAIQTTVGKVKEQIKKIIQKINSQYKLLLMNAVYGPITYYPNSGIAQSDWDEKADIRRGIDITPIQNIFHKPEQNSKGHLHNAERECRFALTVSAMKLKDANDILVSSKEIAKTLTYYQRQCDEDSHYIEKVYTCAPNGNCSELLLAAILNSQETVQI